MSKIEYTAPTEAELAAIRARAHRMRAEATRDMVVAMGRFFRNLFGAASKPAGWRANAH